MTRLKQLFIFSLTVMLFTGSLSAQVLEGANPTDGFYEKVWVEEKQPIPLAFVREADVAWEKKVWQVIDLRERINLPLYFPNTTLNDRQSLMQ
ncbi:MAG: gliding motility protein GldN, partial [Bacteroidota bacterium]